MYIAGDLHVVAIKHLGILIANIFFHRIQDNAVAIFVLIISGVFWLHRLVKFIYNVCCYWEIRSFYINALKMTMVRLCQGNIFRDDLKSCFASSIIVIACTDLHFGLFCFVLLCCSQNSPTQHGRRFRPGSWRSRRSTRSAFIKKNCQSLIFTTASSASRTTWYTVCLLNCQHPKAT